MKVNNVDVEKAGAFVEEVKRDKSKAIKTKRVEGEWNFEDGKPQFKAELKHSTGVTLIEADGPPFVGGNGLKPDPVQYCLFGMAACFAQTYASIAAEKGIELDKLKVEAENEVNLSKAFGLSDEPIVKEVKLRVEVSSNEQEGKIKDIGELARERCPGVYCLANPIKLDIDITYQ